MTARTFDAVVVGGGSGGLAFAKAAARHGASVALVERAELGGTCVNRGCVPKKLMWQAGAARLQMQRMESQGLTAMTPALDLARLRVLSDRKIEGLRDTFAEQLSEAGVTLLRGAARVEGPDRVMLDGERLAADRLVLATGARPVLPEIEGAVLAGVSDDVFTWAHVPERLVVLGGGYIGCEFAAIFSAFGAEVTLIEPGDRLLDTFGEALAGHAERALAATGVRVLTGVKPTRLSRSGAGIEVVCDDNSRHVATRVLAATGRSPDIPALGPIFARLKLADSGALSIDDAFETSVPRVHAIGDAADRLPLTPVARRDGLTLAEQLFGEWRVPVDLGLVPTGAFLYPPHAQVGEPDGGEVTLSEPLRAGVTVARETASDLDFLQLAFTHDRLTGAALAFDGAEEAIAAFSAALAAHGTRDDLIAATGIHPTPIEEILGR